MVNQFMGGMMGGPPGEMPMMEEPIEEACETCRFWQPEASGSGMGLCLIISSQAEEDPDETIVSGDFLCAPTWYCAYYDPGEAEAPPEDEEDVPF